VKPPPYGGGNFVIFNIEKAYQFWKFDCVEGVRALLGDCRVLLRKYKALFEKMHGSFERIQGSFERIQSSCERL